jgi:MarR family 2-MHQ and catechol resistance regulon transcriptional repressor
LGELAEKLLVTGGNVTYVMDRLEDQGLVYRFRRPDDRRVIQAKLTPEGRDLVADVFPGHASYIEHLSRHLTTDEQKLLSGLLKRLGIGIQSKDL